jgi:hypothetical protein
VVITAARQLIDSSGVEGMASLGGIIVIHFLWRQALRKKFPSLFYRKETKQASKEARANKFLRYFSFFLQPCVSFTAALSV